MGGKTSDMVKFVSNDNIWLPIHGICRLDTITPGDYKILEYHKSWDWLIPVIDRIDYKTNIKIDINTKDINDTYNRVVSFIKNL